MLPWLRALREVVAIIASVGAFGACAAIAGVELPAGSQKGSGAGGDGFDLPSEVAFPTTQKPSCAESKKRPFSIKNNRSSEVAYKMALTGHGTFSLVGATNGVREGTLRGGGTSQEFEIEAKGVWPGKQMAELVVTYDNTTTRVVPITADVRGAYVVVTPSLADVGEAAVPKAGEPFSIELRNDGNEDVTLGDLTKTRPEFDISLTSITVPAGQSASVKTYLTGGETPGAVSKEVPLTVEAGVLCGEVPKLKLSGSRVSGAMTVSPFVADFGDVACGGSSTVERTIALRSAAGDANYEVALAANSRFAVSPSSGSFTPAQGADLHVKMNDGAVPLGDFPPEDLTITINGVARTVKLLAHGYGANVTVQTTPPPGEFRVGQTQLFTIRNDGNARVCVKYTNPQAAFVARDFGYLNPQDDNAFGVLFTGTGGARTTTIALDPVSCDETKGRLNAPLCAPRPDPLTVTTVP